jgi:hypothetical protein
LSIVVKVTTSGFDVGVMQTTIRLVGVSNTASVEGAGAQQPIQPRHFGLALACCAFDALAASAMIPNAATARFMVSRIMVSLM